MLIVLDDLTEQERRELAEREFVTNAAHELRTPLTTIIGAVEVLQAGAKDDPVERDRFLAHIEREAERLARLARALLTLARAHAGQERPRAGRSRCSAAARGRGRAASASTASRSRWTARGARARSSTGTCSSRRSATSPRTPPSTRARADRVAAYEVRDICAWRSRTPASG